MNIKERVKSLAKEQGKTLKDIAEYMKIAPETLSRALSGNPTLSTIQSIAGALNVNVKDLFTAEDSSEKVYGVIVVNDKPVKIRSFEDLQRLVKLTKPKNI